MDTTKTHTTIVHCATCLKIVFKDVETDAIVFKAKMICPHCHRLVTVRLRKKYEVVVDGVAQGVHK